MPDITHYHRKPLAHGNFSVEGYFDTVRAHLGRAGEVKVRTVPFTSRGLWRRIANTLYCALRRRGVHHVTGDIHYVTLLLPKPRTVLTVLDCAFEGESRVLRRNFRRLFWYVMPVARCTLVSVISEFTRERLLSNVRCDPRKVRVVPVCVSPAFIRRDRPFNGAKPRILQVGTTENKNIRRLADALAGVPCHLRIIGRLSRDHEAALVGAGIEYSNRYNLSVAEVVAEYESCDLVTLVSTYEGFGMPIVEGNSVGRPVITSNVASMPEVAGDAACLVDPFDVPSIRAGILRVIRDEEYRQQLVANGFRNAERFTAARVAELYEAIYEELDPDLRHPRVNGEGITAGACPASL